jgi:symplekin
MEKAAAEEKMRRAERKRPSATPQDAPEAKRPKLEESVDSAALLSNFDFTTLHASLVTDLIIANLQAFPEQTLVEMIQTYRLGRGTPAAPAPSVVGLSVGATTQPQIANGMPIPTGPRQRSKSTTPAQTPTQQVLQSAISVPHDVRESSEMRSMSRSPLGTPSPGVKEEEPVDPLQMDIDEEEIEFEPDRLNMEVRNSFSYVG